MLQFQIRTAIRPVTRAAGILTLMMVFAQTGSAQSWSRIPNVPVEQFVSLCDDSGTLYASGEAQIYRSNDRGRTWTPLGVVHPDILALSMVTRFDGAIYAGTYKSGIWRSTDDGNSWEAFSEGLSGMGSEDILCFAVRGDSLYAGTGGSGVFVLGRQATEWTPFSEGLPWNNAHSVYTMQVVDGALVATAGGNGGVFRRPAGSSTWIDAPLPDAPLPGLELVEMHQHDGRLYVAGKRRIFFSEDGGMTWTSTDTPFPSSWDVRLASTGTRLHAIVNTEYQGAEYYTSDDGGANWRRDEGIGLTYVSDLTAVDGRLIAAAETGLHEWQVNPTPVENRGAPDGLAIDGSTPHPVRSSATIHFTLAHAATAELTVTDMAGRIHAAMPARTLSAGGHHWVWNTGNLPSGMYLCTLRTGAAAVARPLLLLR